MYIYEKPRTNQNVKAKILKYSVTIQSNHFDSM